MAIGNVKIKVNVYVERYVVRKINYGQLSILINKQRNDVANYIVN